MDTNNKILEKELCYKIVGAIMEVSKKYGTGFKEIIFQKALVEALERLGLKAEQQKRINIYSVDTGKVLGSYVPDLVVEDKIIIEIKATGFTIQQDVNQQRSYLKASKYEIAYLVNFGTPRLDIRRSIYTNNRKFFLTKR
jgi:GxxExxY protein